MECVNIFPLSKEALLDGQSYNYMSIGKFWKSY